MSTRSKLLCCLLTLQTFGKRSSKRGGTRDKNNLEKPVREFLFQLANITFNRASFLSNFELEIGFTSCACNRSPNTPLSLRDYKMTVEDRCQEFAYIHRPWSGDITSSRLSSTLRRGTLRSSSYIDRSDICASQKFIIERRIGKYSTS